MSELLQLLKVLEEMHRLNKVRNPSVELGVSIPTDRIAAFVRPEAREYMLVPVAAIIESVKKLIEAEQKI